MTIKDFSLKRASSSTWKSKNPILKDGQLGFERDTRKLKIGDGVTTWNNLPYLVIPQPYGTCSTAAATVAKTVALSGYKLATGSQITVKFTNGNTATKPTLNVQSTGAKALYYRGSPVGALPAKCIFNVVYDGTYYEIIGTLAGYGY